MKITFEAGTSKYSTDGVNYMITAPGEDTTLYAEVKTPDGASDDYGYHALKADIIKQAQEAGITEPLTFWYDGQEQYLEADASAECEVVR